jgi:hypothetical protein
LKQKKLSIQKKIKDTVWCAELAYLADIFNKLNSLNSSMQGREENVISASDKMNSFSKKNKNSVVDITCRE